MNKKICLCLLSVIILFFPGYSHAKEVKWKWYYASFYSDVSYDVASRNGWSEITISDGKISGYLIEARAPDVKLPLSGSISGDDVTIRLPTFFPYASIDFSGKIRSEITEKCTYQEIRLNYKLLTGETMVMLTSAGDKCT